jgi:hypothetical protein
MTHHFSSIWLGRFANEREAALAYDDKAIELRGLDARVNFRPADRQAGLGTTTARIEYPLMTVATSSEIGQAHNRRSGLGRILPAFSAFLDEQKGGQELLRCPGRGEQGELRKPPSSVWSTFPILQRV